MNKKYIAAMMAFSLFSSQPIWADDAQLVQQLDVEAKQLIIQGDFEAALQKMEAAEILAPDPERMSRIERIRTFIQVRRGIDQIGKTEQDAVQSAKPSADAQPVEPAAAQPAEPAGIAQKTEQPAEPAATAQPTQADLAQKKQAEPMGSQPADQATPAQNTVQTAENTADPEQQRMQTILNAWLNSLGASEQIQTDRDLNVLIDPHYQMVKKDSAYEVQFNQIKLVDGDGSGLNLGQVNLQLQALDEQMVAVRIEFIKGIDLIEYDTVLAHMQWQQQKINGIWNEQHHLFDRFELDLGGITLMIPEASQPNDRADFSIDRIHYQQALQDQSGQDWQQNNRFLLENIRVDLFDSRRNESLQFKLGQFQIEADLSGQEIKKLAQFLQAQAQLNSDDVAALMQNIQLGLDLFQSYDFNLQIGPINMDYKDDREAFSFNLDSINNHFSIDRAQNKAQFAFQFNFDGLSLESNEVPPQLVPHQFNFNLKLNNLPDPAETIKTLMQDPSQQDQLIAQYVQAIEQNKTNLSLDDFSLLFADFGFQFSANTEFKPSLPPLFNIGTAEINIINLPYLMQLGQQMGLLDEELQKALTALSLAAIRVEENGKPKDIFNLQWDAAGKVLINGKDATALFQ